MYMLKTFLILSSLNAISALRNDSNPENFQEDHSHPDVFAFIFGGLLVGAVIRFLIKTWYIPIPYPFFVLIIGMLVGVGAMYNSTFMDYCHIIKTPPLHLLTSFLPVLVFKTAFCIDVHTFVRSWLQIVIISVPVVIVTACFIGVLMRLILDLSWSSSIGILFGTLCTPIYPLEVVHLLKELGSHTKHVSILLEGESMVGVASTIIMHTVILGLVEKFITEWYHVLMVLLRFVFGGLLAGCIFGLLGCFLMRTLYNDAVNVLIITLAFPYVCYYTCEDILYVSGVLCVLVFGVMMSTERPSLSNEMDSFLTNFWEMLAHIINTIIFLIIGVVVSLSIIPSMELHDYALIMVTYLVANVGRFIGFICFAPILSRVGYGMTFSNMTIAVWGGLKSSVSLCLTLVMFHIPDLHYYGREFLMYIVGLFLLTLLINAPITPILLRLTGLSQLSLAKQANMNNCMKHVLSRRERAIAILKMDRFLSDANWPMVQTATTLKHPYKINMEDSEEEDEYFMGYRFATCPDCKKDVLNEPTTKELKEMTREARLRILKAKKICYSRQYENGMLSKEGIRILTQAVEVAMDTEEALIELDGLFKLFKKEGFAHFARRHALNMFKKTEDTIKPPRKYWRRVCYHIVMHIGFEIFIYSAIALNTIPISLEIAYSPRSDSLMSYVLKGVNTVFFLIYLAEFLLKIYGYSWIYVFKHGFRTYFKSYWNIFDFTVLVAALIDLIMDYVDLVSTQFNKSEHRASKITLITKLFRILRFIKLFRLCRACYPRLVKYWDSKIDYHMAFAYDVGKGFVTGEEEVLEMLPHMIDHMGIKDEMKISMEEDRLAVTKQLGLVQKDRPWIAITVKTKQAIRTVLNTMKEAINELKVSGWVDDVEHAKLTESLNERFKFVLSIKAVQPSPPRVIFQEVPWMAGDDNIIEFLYDNVATRKFDPGDQICVEGEVSDGIFIVVTGLLMLQYTPQKDVLYNLSEYGCLPVVDYVNSTKFDESVVDYIVSGNCVGELSTLTGRPYDCAITAETHSQVYVLGRDVIKRAMAMSPDPINGLECRIWRSISIRIAIMILMEVPAYQSSTQNKIKYALERAFMPKLSNYKIFLVNDMMEDIILIEGIVVDFNTRELFTGPCYIPRTVQKLVMTKSTIDVAVNVETKLLIIPAKDVDEYDIMLRAEETCEMVSMRSSKCLQHIIQNQSSRMRKRRKKGGALSFTNRRLTYSKFSKSNMDVTKSRITFTSDTQYTETEVQNINMADGVSFHLMNESRSKYGRDHKK